MIFSIWYESSNTLPSTSGWYYGFKDMSLGDDNEEVGFYYYDHYKNAFFTSVHGCWCNVTFWTDIDFQSFQNKTLTPAERIAADNVIKAIENYNTILGLSR